MLRNTQIYLGVATAIFLVAAGSWWWVFSEISSTRTTMTSYLEQIAAAQEDRSSRVALVAAVEQSEAQRQAISDVYLRRDEVISFLSTIESLASSRVTVDVETLNEVTGDAGERLEIPLSVSGRAEAVRSVLNTLESLPYASYIDNLTLAIETSDSGVSQYDVRVTLVVALQPDNI